MLITNELIDRIVNYLRQHPLPNLNYRNRTPFSKQSIFGIVPRRGLSPDYSKLCPAFPALYKLLLELGSAMSLNFTTVLIVEGLTVVPKLKGVVGDYHVLSVLDEPQEGTLKQISDKKQFATTTDFTFVFYTVPNNAPSPSIIDHNGSSVFKRGDEIISTKRKKMSSLRIERRYVEILFP